MNNFNMEWNINVASGDTIIYENELETMYDDIVVSYSGLKCCIFKLPNTILYRNNLCSPNPIKVLCDKYLFVRFNDGMHIVEISTGNVLLHKKAANDQSFNANALGAKYEDNNYVFLHITQHQQNYVEIYDQSFKLINQFHDFWGTFDQKLISNNYIALNKKTNIQVYDFVNDKIAFENTTNTWFQFVAWKNDFMIYKIEHTTIKVQKIIDKDGCAVCFKNINEKYAIVPCGHTSTCRGCLAEC